MGKNAFGLTSQPGRNFGFGQGRMEELRPQHVVSDGMGLRPQENPRPVSDQTGLRPQERRDSFRIERSFGFGRDGTTGMRWETAETRTGVTLSLRSKPREGKTSVELPRGFARLEGLLAQSRKLLTVRENEPALRLAKPRTGWHRLFQRRRATRCERRRETRGGPV